MNKHKAKCDFLKKVRKSLADTMGIDLHQKECTFEGECTGTCPKCKQEEDMLNREIAKRAGAIAMGATAALTLAACAPTDTSGVKDSRLGGFSYVEEEKNITGTVYDGIDGFPVDDTAGKGQELKPGTSLEGFKIDGESFEEPLSGDVEYNPDWDKQEDEECGLTQELDGNIEYNPDWDKQEDTEDGQEGVDKQIVMGVLPYEPPEEEN